MSPIPDPSFPPLVVSRLFPAQRARVFAAWTSAEALRRWFCPAGYSVPEAHVHFRVGGTFDICMRSPEGRDHWTRGRYVEIAPDSRLVIEMEIPDGAGRILFRARTVATFADEAGGTRLDVTQHYALLDPAAAPMVRGAPLGWSQTLDRLEREVGRAPAVAAAPHRVEHATFRLERTYAAAPAQVYRALTDPVAKARWFSGGAGYTLLAREMDVRVGGRERVQGRWDSGLVSTFDAVYHDLVPDRRLVYSYAMYLDDRKISVSLATFELNPVGTGTALALSEQGAFLDGYDDAGSRERGTSLLLEALGAALAA